MNALIYIIGGMILFAGLKYIRLLILFCLFALSSAASAQIVYICSPENITQLNEGCNTTDRLINLNKGWSILDGVAPGTISSEFLSNPKWRKTNIVRKWDSVGIKGYENKVSYRLFLEFDSPQSNLYLRPPVAITSQRIFMKTIDGQFTKIFDNTIDGGFDRFDVGWTNNNFIQLPPIAASTTLIIQVANKDHVSGQIIHPPALGTLDALQSEMAEHYFYNAGFMGMIIIIIIININMALARKNEWPRFLLSILSIIVAIRLLDSARLLPALVDQFPVLIYGYIGWLTLFATAIVWSIFVRVSYGDYFSRNSNIIYVMVYSIGFIASILGGYHVMVQIGYVLRPFALVVVAHTSYAMTKSIFRTKNHTVPYYLSLVCLMLSAIIDIILQNMGYQTQFTIIGFLGFILFQTLHFNRNYIRALAASKKLAQLLEVKVEERTLELKKANDRLKEVIQRDTLTGLSNRRALQAHFRTIREETRRTHLQNYGLAILDLDFFKRVNDEMGHDTGDAALQQLANLMKEHLRPSDLIARIGGEEFIILGEVQKETDFKNVLERLRETVHKHSFKHHDKEFSLSVSIGYSLLEADDNLESLMKRADIALYKAKNNGRNLVIAAE